ncbi:YheC/YheD family endospore coat-associated protein [Heliorestis convoluta]|uniref:YheC/YheD family protein, putative n=1 Tax=Heliorestis convoluta TaxID=356322 RepID=A0A5Q2MWP6_9FIRM|nr:YheC/YheD family protein [Heliorestis convoluta]QGG46878.1 YheC/YheD family protein, putative [Heliorestis convoluta]
MERITLSVREALRYGFHEGALVPVRAGTKEAVARVHLTSKTVSTSVASKELLQKLHWPPSVPYKVRYSTGEKALLLGPLVGILANRKKGRQYSWSAHLKETQRQARRLGVVALVFAVQDISWEEKTVDGLILQSGTWVRKRFPLPKVIYNRILKRSMENHPDVVEGKEKFEKMGITLFNPCYLDKWETHEHLSGSEEAQIILPETLILQEPSQIWSLIQKYRLVYLKPIHGTHGFGIYRIGVRSTGGYYFQGRNKSQFGPVLSKEAIEIKVKKLLDKTTYVVQQGLRLATVKGAPFDIRLLVQKDSKASWQLTKAFGRIAAPGRFTSNLSQGGTAMGIRNTLAASTVGRKRKRSFIIKEMRRWGLKLPQILEEQSGKNFGELGLDLAVDRSGKIWLLEINSKPRKRLSTEEGDPEQVRLSLQRPILYGRLLDGF